MKKPPSPKTTRRGFSALEFQVAMILLGIAMAGLVPLVVMQMKQLKSMENRWDPAWTEAEAAVDYWLDPYRASDDGPVYYLVPPGVSDSSLAKPWVRKLGAPALIVSKAVSDTQPTWLNTDESGSNAVEVWADPDVTLSNTSASATVTVDPPDPP